MKKTIFFKQILISTFAITTISCMNNKSIQEKEQQEIQTSSETNKIELEHNTKFTIENLDQTVSPKEDFYTYANGGWLKRTEIPSDEGRWGSFNELRDNNNKMTLSLVDKLISKDNLDPNSDIGKIATFFNTALDVEARNSKGIQPIQPILEEISNLDSVNEVVNFMSNHQATLSTLINFGVMGDQKDSDINALYMFTGNLGLPDRDYYVSEEEDMLEKRSAYKNHVSKMFQVIGKTETQAELAAKNVLSIETDLAKSMLTKEDRRKPELTYNKMNVSELNNLVGTVNWEAFVENMGANTNEVIVRQPAYVKNLNNLLTQNNLSKIKDYFSWVVVNDAASYLTEELDETNFDFYGRVLRDVEEQKPLKERVLSQTNGVLGEALGKAYVTEYFPEEAKQTAVEMVENIKKAYENRINNLEWMSPKTKEKAVEKLWGMNVKIGYPDKWKDYSSLELSNNLYENILAARTWNYKEDISKVGENVDKSEWLMNPQTVNAYYHPILNDIVFPAAILQPPFFDYQADAAVNYGGMGAVIGHEISHGFDDQGAKYNVDGNLENWWTEDDLNDFTKLGKELTAQYSSYEALPDVFVNGEFTLGENIGDLGGVNAAYDALQIHLKENGDLGKIDGLTQEQRFFISWATVWRTKSREESLKNQIKTDPHSPGQFRAFGPLVNVDAFYEAFDIQEGDKMFVAPEDRVKIW